jgi:hypothetical protein
MKIYKALRFKSPHRVDWDQTGRVLAREAKREYPDIGLASLAVMTAEQLEDIKKVVRKHGVYTTYLACEQIRKEDAKAARSEKSAEAAVIAAEAAMEPEDAGRIAFLEI